MIGLWLALVAGLAIAFVISIAGAKKEKIEKLPPFDHTLFKLGEMPTYDKESNSWWRGYNSNSQSW